MSIPITICDDSGMARKLMARALPAGWAVDVTFATNGLEGLEAVRNGKGDILFLDLTMPELDGFGVLDAIRREDLPTMVIVVSGDVQEDARRKVMELGALAFIRKPIDVDKLTEVLGSFGLLSALTGESDVQPESNDATLADGGSNEAPSAIDDQVSVDLYDWCRELSNVSMGRAGDLLAHLLGAFVTLSLPRVRKIRWLDIRSALRGDRYSGHYLMAQGFTGHGIAGEALVLVSEEKVPFLHRMIEGAGGHEDNVVELLMDLSNILIGAFLKGLSEQLDFDFSIGNPGVMHARDFASLSDAAQDVLALEVSYTIEEHAIRCDQLVLLTLDSVAALEQLAAYIVD
jgi:CheY-like chemotaxis protein